MLVDLHCHSTCSDGSATAAEVGQRAAARSPVVFALTDHDTCAGFADIAARVPGAVRAVELTCHDEGRSVHILVYDSSGDHRWAELEMNIALWELDPEFHRRSGPPPPRARGISEEELPLSPHYLIGDTEEMVDTLLARRERWGISYVTLPASELGILEPVIGRLAR